MRNLVGILSSVWLAMNPATPPRVSTTKSTRTTPTTILAAAAAAAAVTATDGEALTTTIVSEAAAPPSYKTLLTSFRQTYVDLERPAPIHRNASDTLCFSYVAPPSTASFQSQNELNEHDASEFFLNGIDTRPVALYLPGLDGFGISASTYQFQDLSESFQFWRLTISANDRSSFQELVNAVSEFVASFQNKPVTLIGESCGGLVAAAVAIRLASQSSKEKQRTNSTNASSSPLRGLVLVNPATSFDSTPWETLVPRLTSLENDKPSNSPDNKASLSPYSVLGSMLLSAIIPDAEQTRRIATAIFESLPDSWSASLPYDLYLTMKDAMQNTGERLPARVLEHRVAKWLVVGTEIVNARLGTIQVPVLVVAGQQDRLLPSEREAARLQRLLPQTEILLVKDRGHFVLDDTLNLTEAILYSKIDPLNWNETKAKYDGILDWKLPDDFDAYLEAQVKPLKTVFSPVYFSTDASTGKRWKGMGKIPNSNGDRPLLFVANHQLVGLDMSLFLTDLLEQRNITTRGLAHPVAFMGQRRGKQYTGELGGRTPGLRTQSPAIAIVDGFEKYGAVLVTPRNYYRVLQTGQNALLFPGGAAEAQSGNKSYPLYWPEKVDFVRTAARFNAIIVPLSAIGMNDGVNVIAETKDLLNLPILGERIRRSNANVTSARYDRKNESDLIGFPLISPTLPARNYFLFGKPIDTANVDPSDKDACELVYKEAQDAVRRGIDDLLVAREHDPYKSTPQRLIYELMFGKEAPTFPVDKLNR